MRNFKLGKWFCLGIFVLIGGSEVGFAQSFRKNIQIHIEHGQVELTWEGTAAVYEVQSSSSLDGFEWFPVVRSLNKSASIPLGDERVSLRVGVIGGLPMEMEITDQRRLEILNETRAKILSMEGTDEQTQRSALIDVLGTFNEIDTCGWAESGNGGKFEPLHVHQKQIRRPSFSINSLH